MQMSRNDAEQQATIKEQVKLKKEKSDEDSRF